MLDLKTHPGCMHISIEFPTLWTQRTFTICKLTQGRNHHDSTCVPTGPGAVREQQRCSRGEWQCRNNVSPLSTKPIQTNYRAAASSHTAKLALEPPVHSTDLHFYRVLDWVFLAPISEKGMRGKASIQHCIEKNTCHKPKDGLKGILCI